MKREPHESLIALATNPASKSDILRLDGHALGVNGAQVGVFEERHEVSLGGFLESQDGGGLKAQVVLESLCDFADEALEGQLAEQKLGGLLILADFTQGDGAGSGHTHHTHKQSKNGGDQEGEKTGVWAETKAWRGACSDGAF